MSCGNVQGMDLGLVGEQEAAAAAAVPGNRPNIWNLAVSPPQHLEFGCFTFPTSGIWVFHIPSLWNSAVLPSQHLEFRCFTFPTSGIWLFHLPNIWNSGVSHSQPLEFCSFTFPASGIRLFYLPSLWNLGVSPSQPLEFCSFTFPTSGIQVFHLPSLWNLAVPDLFIRALPIPAPHRNNHRAAPADRAKKNPFIPSGTRGTGELQVHSQPWNPWRVWQGDIPEGQGHSRGTGTFQRDSDIPEDIPEAQGHSRCLKTFQRHRDIPEAEGHSRGLGTFQRLGDIPDLGSASNARNAAGSVWHPWGGDGADPGEGFLSCPSSPRS
ncbi:uncharacterized protein LOC117006900 isoform X2 [Catharus ustulatus]|uniref:uncharacterized protein LOC117006900 isoform X1 n=1 Tax=Catharus ustulatus TaxID=91951 RepID=UPI00140CBC19|nr:uncharacterized protein LOC117006900 isoform X1 [Catharus ustulatus]XP_032935540.1 uncharacterized protein LOC117006900 isoform X2 [Catharus ustulatus]